jgi:DNA-binding GntR family transcriptional regulator
VSTDDETPDVEDAFGAGHTRALQLAHEVVHRIVRLELAPGSAITEGELAEQAETSKPTAREALQWVMFQGLVTPRRGSGYIVAPITLRDARDLLDWWRLNASEAAARAARVGILHEGRDVIRDQLATEDSRQAEEGNTAREVTRDFYAVIRSNKVFAKALISHWYSMARLENLANRNGRIVSEPDILAVFDAIADRDADKARELMRARVGDFEHKVLDALVSMSAVQDVNLTGQAS